jgi:Cu(I)/Ag(I) efflux system membrane fusion protein
MQKIKKFSFLFLAFVVVMGCNTKNKEDHSASGRRKYFYTCSMDPQIKEDKPGKCPLSYGLDPNQKKIIQLLMKLP